MTFHDVAKKPRLGSWLKWFFVLAIASAGIVGIPSQSARAAPFATSCQYNNSSKFDGNFSLGISNTGVGANITTAVPALCTSGNSYSNSSAWAMVASHGGTGGYAQSGYLRSRGQSTVYYFAEYSKCGSNVCGFTHKETSAASGTHFYSSVYDYVSAIHMQVDSTTILTTNFDPTVNWTAPWSPQWLGETHDLGDDIVGAATSPVYFSGLCLRTSRSGGCTTSPSNLTTEVDSSRYHAKWDIANSEFHIWTQ